MTFLNVDEIGSALAALHWVYPGITDLIQLPHRTHKGRTSHALLLRADPSFRCRPGIVLISGAHAREWGGPDTLVYLAADLLEAYSENRGLAYGARSFAADEVRSILRRTDVVIFPVINPDGMAYSMAGAPDSDIACWRKNRNGEDDPDTDRDEIGVDVNRNYDFLWDVPVKFDPDVSDIVGSNDASSDLFHGTKPFSEAESSNVRWLVDQFPSTRWFVDVHSWAGRVLYSWGDDENQTTASSRSFLNTEWDGRRGIRDDAYGEYIEPSQLGKVETAAAVIRDGINAVRGQSYASTQAFWLRPSSYPTSGTSRDWAFGRHRVNPVRRQIYSFTIEFNTNPTIDFFPTWNEMVPMIADVDAGLVALCSHARPKMYEVIACMFTKWIIDVFGRFLQVRHG